jgi:ketosteroid isomerase-like protein
MDEHPNAALLRRAYRAFGDGDLATIGEMLDDEIVYHFGGRSPLAADYKGKEQVFGFWGRQFELSTGTLRITPSTIVACDEYAFALVHASAERDGRTLAAAPGVNVVRLRDGKAVEFWSYTADQYAVDQFWS